MIQIRANMRQNAMIERNSSVSKMSQVALYLQYRHLESHDDKVSRNKRQRVSGIGRFSELTRRCQRDKADN